MEVAKVHVHGAEASTVYAKPITSGMIGATVSFELDSAWNELSVVAVFRAGNKVLDAVYNRGATLIPHELLVKAGVTLYVGLQGVDSQQVIVIPTVWANLGRILEGANPSGKPGAPPGISNPLWVQLNEKLDDHLRDENNPHRVDAEDINLKSALEETLAKAKESGLFDGATFTPSVSKDGELSWRNDKGLENPDPVDLTGPQGVGVEKIELNSDHTLTITLTDGSSYTTASIQGPSGIPAVYIGELEPESGPAFWFDTGTTVSRPLYVTLVLGDEGTEGELIAVIDGESYPVENADTPVAADDGASYIINIT